jgi:hypothetical protein
MGQKVCLALFDQSCGQTMIDALKPTFDWIRDDWRSNPLRFAVELCAWAVSVSCSFIMAITVPDPPLLILYPLWISGCIMYSWAAWSRRSFGMLGNYILLTTIDTLGLIRMLLW